MRWAKVSRPRPGNERRSPQASNDADAIGAAAADAKRRPTVYGEAGVIRPAPGAAKLIGRAQS
jgi:hypothetical protein